MDKPDAIHLPDQFSPTSLNKLIGNPLYWILEYVARMSKGRAERLPSGVLMMGRFAHQIIGCILGRCRGNQILTPDAAAIEADKLFKSLGPRLFAEFFVAGRERECAKLQRQTVDATRDLFRHLHDAKARVAAVEEKCEKEVDGIALRGFPDLVLECPDMVLDIKWGRAEGRKKELSAGGASQLAIYTMLVNSKASIGYYIVQDQALIVTGTRLTGDETIDGPTPADIWAGTRKALARANRPA